MRRSLKAVACLSVMALCSAAAGVNAAEAKTDALLYISPNDYKYSIHLLHPYYDYWFTQGPIVEPIAFQALKEKYSQLQICKANETADTIIRIKPYLFYNPQLRMYHSKLEATIYSGSGSVLATYAGEARQLGFTSVDTGINYHLNKVYTLAMQNLMSKLQKVPMSEGAKTEARLPCGLIGERVGSKINFY